MAKDEKTTAADKGKGKAVETPEKKDAPTDKDKKEEKNGATEGVCFVSLLARGGEAC